MEVVFSTSRMRTSSLKAAGITSLKGSNGGGRTHAGHDVFTLGVHQEFAINSFSPEAGCG